MLNAMKPRFSKAQAYDILSHHPSWFKWLYSLISHFYHRFSAFRLADVSKLRLVLSETSQQVEFTADGLNLVGNFYWPQGQPNNTTIVLLHGSSIFGRQVSLMRVLASEFQRQGYAVMRFDLRGYGESDDPTPDTPEAFNFAQDVSAAIDWVEKNAPEFTDHIYVVGHSFGGAVALAAQAHDTRVEKIVSFGPPRRLSERFFNPEAREKQKLLVRWQSDMQLNQPLPFDLWQKVLRPLNIENYVTAFSEPGHTPVFLIDAENEPPADLAFLRDFYQQTNQSIDYWTVPNTDHYLVTGFLLGQPCYHTTFVDTFVKRVDQWLHQ
jgi:pimeloyl-ACP methyl ester carboxylesterase